MSCIRRAPRKEREKMERSAACGEWRSGILFVVSEMMERMIEMSKWTDVRDNVVDALHVEDVTEDVKQHVTATLLSEVMPVIENAVDSFCSATKEQAKTETGWCKIRDGVVLPLLMQGGVYVVKLVLSKTVAQTAAA